jgi:hypothetical protein
MGSKKRVKRKPLRKAKPKVASKLSLINLKVSGKDRKAIQALANKHADGNYSAWLRHAGLHYRPKKAEKIL